MLTNNAIEVYAQDAARVAYAVLGLDCPYSVILINDPTVPEDARLDTQKNQVQINLAVLEPFSTDVMPADEDEDPIVDENYRHTMKVYSLVYHEMRHLYQKRAVEAYMINRSLGGGRTVPALESDKKCALWLSEMQAPAPDQDIEEDAEDFAYYLSNRHPIQLPMLRTSRRLAAMKRKYDKIEIPKEEPKKSFTINTSIDGNYTFSEDNITHVSFRGSRISKGLLMKKHYKESELALYTAWVLREGRCYEAKQAWYHTEEDLKDAPHLEQVLKAMEAQLNKLTDGEYSSTVEVLQQDHPDIGNRMYWSEIQDIWWEIKNLREGKYHGSDSPRYEGRRGIPRIETVGKRLVDAIVALIWKMDNVGDDGSDGNDECDEAMSRFEHMADSLLPEEWDFE